MEPSTTQPCASERHNVVFTIVLVVAASLFAASSSVSGQSPAAADGPELFKTYCAPCHGIDAIGNGPIARALRHAPPDLTLMAKRNGDVFPVVRVRRIVEGRDVESHGDREMPVWGDAFAPTRDGRSPGIAEARLSAIVRYLETIQRHDAQ